MRKLLFFQLLLLANMAFAQQTTQQPFDNRSPYSQPLQFGNSLDTVRPRTFEDYLVLLAWQNSYDIEGASHDVVLKGYEIGLAKDEWKRNIAGGTVNMNDVSLPYFMVNTLGVERLFGQRIDLTRIPAIATYPVWNVGTTINFGDLVLRKNKVRVANEKKKISEAEMNYKKQKLRGEVLKRYEELSASYQIFKIRLQSLDAAEAIKVQVSNLFALNKARIEEYNESNKNYFDAMEAKVRAESDIRLKKVALEELIGIKWEQVEPFKANYEKQR